MPTKPTLAFVDHGLHRKTNSGDLFRKLFAAHFEIKEFWDDSWENKTGISAETLNRFDYVFFEQTILPLPELKKITAQMIWAPMYDGYDKSFALWKYLPILGIKILALSKALHKKAIGFGAESIYSKYCPDPNDFNLSIPQNGRHIFFWERGEIEFKDIKKIITPNEVDSFIYRINLDPSYHPKTLSEEDRKIFHVEIYASDYLPKENYLNLLSRANVFIAPRKKEGIGLSFLEAMAAGQCVIAHDDATMNEYIINGKNGILVDYNQPTPQSLENISAMGKTAREDMVRGHQEWSEAESKIINFILNSKKIVSNSPHPILDFVYAAEKKVPLFKRYIARQKTKIRRKIKL